MSPRKHTVEARNALDAPANNAAMPTKAANFKSIDGIVAIATPATTCPSAPPMVNNGAIVPPEVPLEMATVQERNFITHKIATACSVN